MPVPYTPCMPLFIKILCGIANNRTSSLVTELTCPGLSENSLSSTCIRTCNKFSQYYKFDEKRQVWLNLNNNTSLIEKITHASDWQNELNVKHQFQFVIFDKFISSVRNILAK